MLLYIIEGVMKSLSVVIGVLLGVAYLTVAERKYLSSIQRRRGPNVIGMYGLLQAIGDGVKLIIKETSKPISAKGKVFMAAPLITFTISIASYAVMPWSEGVVLADIHIGVLYVLSVSSIGVYGIILGGWSSNSKYGFIGSIRSTAQMISYEVSIGFVVVSVIMYNGGGMNLSEIVMRQERVWNIITLLPLGIIFVISIIAETNRHPFDLPEAESELVSGYNVEYSGGGFALFFLGEYGSIIMMSGMMTIMFLGGWTVRGSIVLGVLIFSVKVFIMCCVFIWARAAYPRYRYDQLMDLGWKNYLPISLGYIIYMAGSSYGMA